MNTQQLKIKEAIQALIEAQNHRAFQRIAIHLAKRKWPEIQATEEQSDGGEDATSFEASADGRRRRVAVSLTGTLTKIRLDAGRLRERGVKLDSLVFPKHDLLGAVSVLAALDDPRAVPLLTRLASEKYSTGMVMNGFHTLVLQGTVLSGDEMASFLDRFIGEQEKEHRGSNNDTWYLVVRAIAILLFSDKPALGIERIRKLPEYRLKNYYVRDLLGLLGASQTPAAIDLIVELALKPEINEHYLYEVATVLSKSRNPAAEGALVTLLDKFCAGELDTHDAHSHLPKAFAQVAKSEGRIWQEIRRRCASAGSSHERKILLAILSEAEGLDTSSCLCDLIDHEFPSGYAAEHVVEESVTKNVPAGGTSYYIKPRSAADFKKRLIDIASSEANRKASAARLLDIVGRVRAEYGWPANGAIPS